MNKNTVRVLFILGLFFLSCEKTPEKININVLDHQGGTMWIRSEVTWPFPQLIIEKDYTFEYGFDSDISEAQVDFGECRLFNKDGSFLWLKKDEFTAYLDGHYYGIFPKTSSSIGYGYLYVRWINIVIPKRPSTEYQYVMIRDSTDPGTGKLAQSVRTEIYVKTNIVRTIKP